MRTKSEKPSKFLLSEPSPDKIPQRGDYGEGVKDMRKAALLLAVLTLLLPASVRSELPSADPRYPAFRVDLAHDFPIRFSPRMHTLRVPKWRDQFLFHDVFRALESDSFTIALKPADRTRLMTLDLFEGLPWDPSVFN